MPYKTPGKTSPMEHSKISTVKPISLPSGYNYWHMYVIDSQMERDDYLAYSRFYNDINLVTREYVKTWIRGCKGTDILTYTIVN
jgi:hypothetical protein